MMIHDNTGTGRASTACHYSPSLVAEDQLHGSKDTLTLKGEKALLELLLDMVCHSCHLCFIATIAESGSSPPIWDRFLFMF
jgi:hypothetical protein